MKIWPFWFSVSLFFQVFFSDPHLTKEPKDRRSGLFFVAVLGFPTATSRWGQPSDGRETMTSNENSLVSGAFAFFVGWRSWKKGGEGVERGGWWEGGDYTRGMEIIQGEWGWVVGDLRQGMVRLMGDLMQGAVTRGVRRDAGGTVFLLNNL
jgi:hypothetical protein